MIRSLVPLTIGVPLLLTIWSGSSPAGGDPYPRSIAGDYYRGTATGEDHDLRLSPDGQLTLVNGGCVRTDAPLLGTWAVVGPKLIVSGSPELLESLGRELSLRREGRITLLVPVALEASAKRDVYGAHYVFWPIALRNVGLKRSWPETKP